MMAMNHSCLQPRPLNTNLDRDEGAEGCSRSSGKVPLELLAASSLACAFNCWASILGIAIFLHNACLYREIGED